jgi:hypothetical protein
MKIRLQPLRNLHADRAARSGPIGRAARTVVVPLAVVASLTGAPSAASAAGWPDSMAAIGDSFSAAFNTHADTAVVPSPPDLSACPNGRGPFGDPTSVGLPASFGLDCPSNSWSTGTNPHVNSIYQRILARNPAIAGNVANWATTAVSVSDLAHQADRAVSQGAELVTVNVGINDACDPFGFNGGQQTPLDAFRSQFEQAMSVLAAAPAQPRILVATIPNANRTWRLFRDDPNAQVRWQFGVICPPLLNNPTSTAAPDVARRAEFLARLAAYNLIEADVCRKTPRCQTDGGALFAWQFGRADIATVTNTGAVNAFPFTLPVLAPVGPGAIPNSTGDYWHATVRGQATIAQRVWNAAKLGG